jgi:hypothetical protein
MQSSGMLRRVALLRTDDSEELSASIRVTRIGDLDRKRVRFEIFTAVTMKNGVFWDGTPRGCS